MKLHDISRTLRPGVPVWPGDMPFTHTYASLIERGDEVNLSRIGMSMHCGTHIDAPRHFLKNGYYTSDIALEALVGLAVLIEPRVVNGLIQPDELSKIGKYERVLLKTNSWNEALGYSKPDFAAISTDAALKLVKNEVKVVGIDTPSIATFSDSVPVHEILLSAGIAIIENLDFGSISAGEYELVCLPLKIAEAEGAPARVILIER